MKVQRSEHVERRGVYAVGQLVHGELAWLYREQPIEDYGIDAHIEVVDGSHVTGHLIAVQIRSRERRFDRVADGWMVRDSAEHLDYWLGHVLPVILVVYDVPSGRAYWQRVSRHTVKRTDRGFKMAVPESQPFDATACDALREIATRDDDRKVERFPAMCSYLPSPCADVLERARADDPLAAARLASLLADGRSQPSLTAQSVLAAPPRGMTESSWRLWQAVGSYAAEHDLPLPAAEALERAAEYADPPAKPRLFGLAACLFAEVALATADESNGAEARRLAASARELEPSNLLADLADAMVDAAVADGEPTWRPRAWRLPASVEALTEDQLRHEPMIGIALGDESLLRGDVEAAVRRYECAVQAMPTLAGPKLKLAHALVRRAVNGSPLAAADYDDAERLAREALVEQRRWAGPSERGLELLLQILLARSSFTEALVEASLCPAGTALPREAGHEGVRLLGARAALALGKLDAADTLADEIVDPLRRAQFVAWRREVERDPANCRQAWELVADLACGARDLTALLVASHKLAMVGVWPIGGLDEAAATGVLPANLVDVLAAVADAANGNVDRAIARLRVLGASDLLAVEHHAQLLEAVGRVDDAVAVCVRGADQFQAPHLRFMASDMLARAGRADEAAAPLSQLLASGVGSADVRRSIRLRLLEHGYSQGDWSSVEGHALAELGSAARDTVPPVGRPFDETDQFAWALVSARYNRRDLEAALAAWQRYKPAIATPEHARAWVLLHRARTWQPDTVELALAIAEHWPHEEQLVSHVVATVLLETAGDEAESRLELSEDLAARFAAVQSRYHADYPDGALRVVEFDPDRFVESMMARLQSMAKVSADLEGMVRDHRLPVGMFASAFHRPYALAVLTRPAGVTPAGTPFDNDYDVELEVAGRALGGGTAVCEASSLYLTVLLDEHWPTIRGRFHSLLLPLIAYDDIVRAVDELVVPSAGTMQYDPRVGKLVLHTPTPEASSLLRERAAAMEARARTLDRLQVGELTALPGQDGVRDGAWLAPIQMAADTGYPLYSDDVAIRQLARSVGVDAFGTLALLHVLIDRGDVHDVTDAVLRTLVSEYVVDLPVPIGLLIEIAARDQWLSGPGLTVLARPRWWADFHEALEDFLDVVPRVVAENPAALHQWVYAAAVGAARNSAPDTRTNVIAIVATVVVASVTGLANALFAEVVAAAQDAARSLACDDPTGHMIAGLSAWAADLTGRDAGDPAIRSDVEAAFSELEGS